MPDRTPSPGLDLLLAILAFPITLGRAVMAMLRARKRLQVIRKGTVTCPSPMCQTINTLARMNRCPNCGHVAPSNLLYCSNCHETYEWITCEGCGRSLKVL